MLAACVVAATTLYTVICSFSWYRNRLSDYGIYANMMWNTAHGHPFLYLINGSYLRVHLSFTLGLFSLLYRAWDHPLLLCVLQWSCSVLGTLAVVAAARRRALPALMTAALAFFYLGYRFTQSVHVHDFHGVALYLFLVPLLYLALVVKRAWSWLPLTLILGLREDAFLVVLPMLLYFTVRERRMGGAWLALAALIYGAAAVFLLYPALNGTNILATRETEFSAASWLAKPDAGPLVARLHGLVLFLLPVLVAGRRAWGPALLFPSFAVLQCLASNWPSQYAIGTHYSAPVMATLICGLVESLAPRAASQPAPVAGPIPWGRAAALLTAITVAVHVESGFLPGGGKSCAHLRVLNPEGLATLRAAARIPREGVLMTDNALVSFCANRHLLKVWHLGQLGRTFDHAFFLARDLESHHHEVLLQALRDRTLGVRYYDGIHVVLSRGFDPRDNDLVLHRREREHFLHEDLRHAGRNGRAEGLRVRYWEGDGSRAPASLAHGTSWNLAPGTYEFTLSYRSATPRRSVRGNWGWLSVHRLHEPEPLARTDLPPTPAAGHEWQRCAVRFTLDRPTAVEYRVTGGDARLWLRRVNWSPVPPAT